MVGDSWLPEVPYSIYLWYHASQPSLPFLSSLSPPPPSWSFLYFFTQLHAICNLCFNFSSLTQLAAVICLLLPPSATGNIYLLKTKMTLFNVSSFIYLFYSSRHNHPFVLGLVNNLVSPRSPSRSPLLQLNLKSTLSADLHCGKIWHAHAHTILLDETEPKRRLATREALSSTNIPWSRGLRKSEPCQGTVTQEIPDLTIYAYFNLPVLSTRTTMSMFFRATITFMSRRTQRSPRSSYSEGPLPKKERDGESCRPRHARKLVKLPMVADTLCILRNERLFAVGSVERNTELFWR